MCFMFLRFKFSFQVWNDGSDFWSGFCRRDVGGPVPGAYGLMRRSRWAMYRESVGLPGAVNGGFYR